MARVRLTSAERKDFTSGAEILPAGAYVCIITEARIAKSKKGKINLLVTWDVAEGEFANHFNGAQYGHTEWLSLEDEGANYTAARLDKVSQSNSVTPVTFDAPIVIDAAADAYEQMGCTGEYDVAQMKGRMIGLIVGTRTETYQGKTNDRNFVAQWVTPDEVRAGKYKDSKGMEHDITIPKHRMQANAVPQQTAGSALGVAEDDSIPF